MCHGYDCLCKEFLKELANKGDKKALLELEKRKSHTPKSPKQSKKRKKDEREKVIAYFLFILFFTLFGFFAGILYVTFAPYKTPATVTEIEEDLITVTTEHGNAYQFYGTGFYNGEKVIISIDNKGDNDFNNDEIVDVIIERK